MFHYLKIPTFVLMLFFASTVSFGQKAVDDVVVTGEVTKIVLCQHNDDVWIYNFSVTLHAKNLGKRPAIISTADGMTDYYKLANHLDDLNARQYSHTGW